MSKIILFGELKKKMEVPTKLFKNFRFHLNMFKQNNNSARSDSSMQGLVYIT